MNRRTTAYVITSLVVVVSMFWGLGNQDGEQRIIDIEFTPPAHIVTIPGALTLDESFILHGRFSFHSESFEITIHNRIGWTTADLPGDNFGRDVFYLPMSITNITNETRSLWTGSVRQYSPDGLMFRHHFMRPPSSRGERNHFYADIHPGVTQEFNLHFLYVGEGEYQINFHTNDRHLREVVFEMRE